MRVLKSKSNCPGARRAFHFRLLYPKGEGMKVQKRAASETVKNLVVDKAEFDRALRKLIATPPLRAADIGKRKSGATRQVQTSR